jgi:hypothetical protein
VQGNGVKIQLSTGTTTTNDCVKFDVNGNAVDAGAPCGSSTPANPTATAGPAAVNGAAGTFMRSDAAPAVQKGTNAQFGIIEGDGTTITCVAGVCSTVLTQTIGTWSPIDGSGAGLTFTSIVAGYTQIGNMVFAYFNLTYPATATTNNAQINGLPVTSANSAAARQCFVTYSNDTTLRYVINSQNSTSILLYNSSGAPVTNVQMSGNNLIAECIYPAT